MRPRIIFKKGVVVVRNLGAILVRMFTDSTAITCDNDTVINPRDS